MEAMQSAVQRMYDWVRSESPTIAKRCADLSVLPVVKLFVRSRPVEGAYETTMQFFEGDPGELPATVLPVEHRKTLANLMDPSVGSFFRVSGPTKPGSAILVWTHCVFDDVIRVKL